MTGKVGNGEIDGREIDISISNVIQELCKLVANKF